MRRGSGSPTEPKPRPLLTWIITRLIHLFAMLPLRAIQLVGAVVGNLAWLLRLRERRVTEINLQIAFPDLDRAARRRLTRRSMVETAKTFAELSAGWIWSHEKMLRHIHGVHGEPVVRQALAEGRGVILAGPHLGNWEIGGIELSTRFPLTALYQRPRLMELEPVIKASRERLGATMVPAGMSAVRILLAALRRGEMIGILPDQEPGDGMGIFVPLFGVQANTMMLLSKLAARTGALVVMGYAKRLPRGRGFDLHYLAATEEISDPDVERSATALNREIERLIRLCPEQYLWSYKRYRIRPPGERNPYATK
jgi:KDO2-lipid IV(A) lauroyltransferase